jgi:hypothetical protein
VQKLLLLSVVLAAICVPVLAAQGRSGPRALKKTVTILLFFNAFYLFAILYLYGSLG